ncbi:MAG: type I 3-dehydroquinate dehydratase [Candidatus Bathyarchaeia archaeon]
MKVKICVPIPAESLREAFEMIRRAERVGADIIEMRLDYLGPGIASSPDMLGKIVKCASTPLIATNRHPKQGGFCRLSEGERIRTLLKAAEAGFTYVDVELTTDGLRDIVSAVKAYGAKAIISFHNFDYTPEIHEMDEVVRAEVNAGADICKVVTMARSLDDSIRCLLFTREISQRTELVCFAMGKYGLLSRILSPLFGASFTYASLGEGLETAPGQLTIDGLREIYRRLGVE